MSHNYVAFVLIFKNVAYFHHQQVVCVNGLVYDVPPKSNELCTNVQVELTIPPVVLGRRAGDVSEKF